MINFTYFRNRPRRLVVPALGLLLVLGVMIPLQAFAQTATFDPPIASPFGATFGFVERGATGDFNEDGRLDVVLTDGGLVRLLLGDGAGGFASPIDLSPMSGDCAQFSESELVTCTSGIWAFSVGDVNGDGHLDFVTANNGSQNLSVVLGNGNGTFVLPPTNYRLLSGGRSVALGDLDGDGDLDLIGGTSQTPNNVRVRLNNGSGAFGAPVDFSSGGSNTNDMETADLNGDGNPDLVVSNRDSPNISVMLSDGLGGFAAITTYTLAGGPGSVTVGDFNGDGRPDLAASLANSNQVAVLLASGAAGSFGSVVNYSTGSIPRDVAVADFDGDGNLDLVTANSNSGNAVPNGDNASILAGNGLGSFGAPTNHPSTSDIGVMFRPYQVFPADWNGDSKPDILTVNRSSRNVTVMLNTTPTTAVLCNGLVPTLVGTDDADILIGTDDPDVIVGLGGDDIILGMGGGDTICAGDGNDIVRGGSGNDWISGDDGNDVLFGDSGRDRIYGRSGDDTIDGGAHGNWLYGNNGHDIIDGRGGHDRIFGGRGHDIIAGRSGDDEIRCGAGDDIAHGGPGADSISSGASCEHTVSIE